MGLNEYRGVLVFAEQIDGKLSRVSLELLGKGRELASALNVELAGILLGSQVKSLAQELICYGADRVFLVDDPKLAHYQTGIYTSVITQQLIEAKPEILLIGATDIGRDLAPRVARRIGTGLTADCTSLAIDKEKRLLLQTKPGYGGNMMFTFICPEHRPQMATVRPGVMQASIRDSSRNGEVINVPVQIEEKDMMVKTLKRVKEARQGVNLEEARIIVAGGKGVGRAEKFSLIHELADVLGAQVGATRDVVDAGWISDGHMVGQTGKTVKPELYIACGISGAVQHVSGIWDSKTIVAINTDPNAEIFKVADFGIVGDLHEVLPALIEGIIKKRSEK
jgi:electron transfer flavoprotein alpha subunit